jgi:hypothetical protein
MEPHGLMAHQSVVSFQQGYKPHQHLGAVFGCEVFFKNNATKATNITCACRACDKRKGCLGYIVD